MTNPSAGGSIASAFPTSAGVHLSTAAALTGHVGNAALAGLPADLEPIVGGFRVGGLVEVHSLSPAEEAKFGLESANGSLGQIVSCCAGEPDRLLVYLTCGTSGYLPRQNLRCIAGLAQPGSAGGAGGAGGQSSFDILLGPRTEIPALTSTMNWCLVEKGFCVLRCCIPTGIESSVAKLEELSAAGCLKRLAEEVEQGSLGFGCCGKVAWLDAKQGGVAAARAAEDELLCSIDGNLSFLAQLLQASAPDVFEEKLDERTPGLLAVGLGYEEELDFPHPQADDRTLGVFLTTWRRSLARAVHFMGPGTAKVVLEGRRNEKASKVPCLQSCITIACAPNTILLFRPDIYDYSCQLPEQSMMVVANFLCPAPVMAVTSIPKDFSSLSSSLTVDGPPPPAGDNRLHVANNVCRLPGNWDSQWDMYSGVTAGTDTVMKIPFTRWDVDFYYTENTEVFEEHNTTTMHQSFCEGTEFFDNKYFEISNSESSGMDPVQRLLLETGAQSLAMIGLTKKVASRTSTHAGFCVGNDKLDWQTLPKPGCTIGAACGGTSTVLAIIANRFNFVFNLKGPSFVCDTACSASLTSTHCAKMMILERQFDPLEWFLTMGAHLCLSGAPFIGCSQSHMSSPKGRCFTFNASADGYLRGEGVSGFMMKWGNFPADEMDAALRATQTGQDGKSASLTAPNGPAQEEMIRRCFNEAKMTPPESTVWDCHGTGTSLGDPIEVGAVRKVQIRFVRDEPLMLASTKTNIGHLEGGAAMSSMIKCILQVKHGRCVPTLHMKTLNPHLEHAAFDAHYLIEGTLFAYSSGHAQVSSFGFGGTNGHGIFWGQSKDFDRDLGQLYMKRLRARPPPEVRPMGRHPDDWEADFPDTRTLSKNCTFRLVLSPDDKANTPLRWEVADYGLDEDHADEVARFWVIGNFNDWVASSEAMSEGEVLGVHVAELEVPSSGTLQFRFLKNGDPELQICPTTPFRTRCVGQITGPGLENADNYWVVTGQPGEQVRVELFSRYGKFSVMWLTSGSE